MDLLLKKSDEYLQSIILQRLKEGESPYSVAVWVQQDLCEYADISTDELVLEIKNFYKTVVPVEERLSSSRQKNAIKRTVAKYREKTSALEEMITLYLLQKGRIELAHEVELETAEERKQNKALEAFNQEVDELLEEDSKRRRKRKPNTDSVISGTLDNTIETARRLLVDIHKMRQDLNLDPKQVEAENTPRLQSITPEYEIKRSKIIQKALEKFKQAEDVEVVEVE